MAHETPKLKNLCEVYKSAKDEGMYLFVDRNDGLDRVPEALLARFGKPLLVTTITLTPERKLARADAGKVLEAIRDNGFYLQMPPAREDLMDQSMATLGDKNQKLPR